MIDINNTEDIFNDFLDVYNECIEILSKRHKKLEVKTAEDLENDFSLSMNKAKAQFVYWLADGIRQKIQIDMEISEFEEYKDLFNFIHDKLQKRIGEENV